MKLLSAAIRNSLLFIAAFLIVPVFLGMAVAQQTSSTKKEEPTRAKFPAAKTQKSTAPDADKDADADSQSAKEPGVEKDSPDSIRKRDQWFYKQRSSANGHIPAELVPERLLTCNGGWKLRVGWCIGQTVLSPRSPHPLQR